LPGRLDREACREVGKRKARAKRSIERGFNGILGICWKEGKRVMDVEGVGESEVETGEDGSSEELVSSRLWYGWRWSC
jgi:hypothetical protein